MNLKRIISFFRSPDSVPIALLAAILLAFGLLSPWLGFYQDDWHFIYYAFARGLGKLWELSAYDNRPFASWPYITGFFLLGFRPFGWQVAGFLVRWLTAIAFWLVFRSLWPKQNRLTAAAALLFSVYPLYTLQPMAVTYITHWVCYFLYGLSLFLMILGVREPRKHWPYLLLSVLLDGIQLFTIEYFNGLELLRPLILWFAVSNAASEESAAGERKSSIKKTILYWLPYLFVLAAFVVWRGFIFQAPSRDNNAPFILYDLFSNPVSILPYLLGAVLKDSLLTQIGVWWNTLQPSLIEFSPSGIAFFAVGLAGVIGSVFYLKHLSPIEPEAKPDSRAVFQALSVGILGLVLGPIPAWLSGQPMYASNPLWNSRLGMASMAGAALVMAALIEWLVRTANQRLILYGILIGLSINYLLHSANTYRAVWSAETDFFEQLTWRAPSLKPDTAIVTEEEVISYMGDYPMGFSINSVYAKAGSNPGNTVPYWFFSLSENFADRTDAYFQGMPITARKLSMKFRGDSSQNLSVTYAPDQGECLWVLRPEEANAPYLSPLMQQAAKVSALDKISAQPEQTLLSVLVGNHPAQTWCTYYEKAQLARDQNDWQSMAGLWEQAQQAGFTPGNDLEYFPFLEAYAQLGDWKSVSNLLQKIQYSQKSVRPGLCFLWNRILQDTPASPQRDQLTSEVRSRANCP